MRAGIRWQVAEKQEGGWPSRNLLLAYAEAGRRCCTCCLTTVIHVEIKKVLGGAAHQFIAVYEVIVRLAWLKWDKAYHFLEQRLLLGLGYMRRQLGALADAANPTKLKGFASIASKA